MEKHEPPQGPYRTPAERPKREPAGEPRLGLFIGVVLVVVVIIHALSASPCETCGFGPLGPSHVTSRCR
jgi:hypothetical protein